MKIRQGLEEVKQEFSNDEKMLTSVFKIEAFLRKNKKILLGFVVVVIVALAGKYFYEYQKEQNAQKSTALLEQIWENPQDENLKKQMQTLNPTLYDFLMLQTADNAEQYQSLSQSKNAFVAEYARYQTASLQKKFEGEFGVYQDLATIQKGFLLLKDGKRQEADEVLNQISVNSELYEIVLRMKHYGITR